jgi:putative hydrolase of the HAD superfamily
MLRKPIDVDTIRPMVPIPTGQTPKGRLTTPVDCIMFDVYGTLFISESGDISMARNRSRKIKNLEVLLEKYGIDRPVDDVLDSFFALIRSTHAGMKQRGVDYPEIEIDAIWMQVLEKSNTDSVKTFAMEFEFLTNPVYPMPNAEALFKACSDRSIPMGIISNAQFFTPMLFDIFLGASLHQLGFKKNFIYLSYQWGYAKPSLYLYEKAAATFHECGIPISNVLYIGNDMLNDIYPADRIGFQTSLFAGDRRSLRLREDDPRCKSLAPDLVITDLNQVIDHVNREENKHRA